MGVALLQSIKSNNCPILSDRKCKSLNNRYIWSGLQCISCSIIGQCGMGLMPVFRCGDPHKPYSSHTRLLIWKFRCIVTPYVHYHRDPPGLNNETLNRMRAGAVFISSACSSFPDKNAKEGGLIMRTKRGRQSREDFPTRVLIVIN